MDGATRPNEIRECFNIIRCAWHPNGLGNTNSFVQDCGNSSVLAMKLLQSCTRSSIYLAPIRILKYAIFSFTVFIYFTDLQYQEAYLWPTNFCESFVSVIAVMKTKECVTNQFVLIRNEWARFDFVRDNLIYHCKVYTFISFIYRLFAKIPLNAISFLAGYKNWLS